MTMERTVRVVHLLQGLQFGGLERVVVDLASAMQERFPVTVLCYDTTGPLADRLAGNLSAGQKRRLGLARLMVTGRPVWVLDEPTVSLDTASVALFAAAVRRHLAEGGSALIATHIDLGIPEAEIFDMTPYKAAPRAAVQDEAFL